jgi:putative ABC transport system substrate-binding protein
MTELGYVEGRNLVIEGRFYGDRLDRLPALAAELARLPVDVIVAGTAPAPEAARAATSTIPIVMAIHPDPVGSGLVANLARPGGNATGLSLAASDLRRKQLEILKETLPGLSRVAVLIDPNNPSHKLELTELATAARALRVELTVAEVRAKDEIAPAVATVRKTGAGALVVPGGSLFFSNRTAIVEAVAAARLPAMYVVREFAEAGGLMAYGGDLRESFRRAALYVDRILRGARPADLPVEQPTRFELAVNLNAAKSLGLTLPPSVLARAVLIE